MITPRQFILLAALCGMIAPAGWNIHKSIFESSAVENAATPAVIDIAALEATSPITVTGSLGETASAKVAGPAVASLETPDATPASPPETARRLISAFPSKTDIDDPVPPVRAVELTNECLEAETCVDEYLWSLYERTPKVDTNKVITKIKKAIKKDGKLKTILASITNYVIGDFTWKDPDAAQRSGMSLKDYVIGGMDPKFRIKLFRALRQMDAAGFMPGITSAFRDDYRQAIAVGNKASSDSSYHGGSRRGGFGKGLAADLVSLKGETRKERLVSSDALWKWIDSHEKELAIGRPYRDRDPPHVGPLDGKEYADKRGAANAKAAAAKAKPAAKTAKTEAKKPAPAVRRDAGIAKHAKTEKSAKVSSLQTLAVER